MCACAVTWNNACTRLFRVDHSKEEIVAHVLLCWLYVYVRIFQLFFLMYETLQLGICRTEVCLSEDKYVMCPLSDIGEYWSLSDVCFFVKVAYLFDHPGTVFYAVFVSFWGQ